MIYNQENLQMNGYVYKKDGKNSFVRFMNKLEKINWKLLEKK